jgi:hypothetical protein
MRSIMRKHKPKGWAVREHAAGADGKFLLDGARLKGETWFEERVIHTVRVLDRYALAVFLHECGHAHMQHVKESDSSAQDEFEAEMYAVKAMRAAGLAVPKTYLEDAREYVGLHVKAEPDIEHSEPLLRFVYGRKWRERA